MTERLGVNRWTVTLEEDPATGDLMMPLPPELLEMLDWQLGDTVVWEIIRGEQGNQVILSKKENDNGTQDDRGT
jgi:hypothetical protein